MAAGGAVLPRGDRRRHGRGDHGVRGALDHPRLGDLAPRVRSGDERGADWSRDRRARGRSGFGSYRAQVGADHLGVPLRCVHDRNRVHSLADGDGRVAADDRHRPRRRDAQHDDAALGVRASAQAFVDDHDHVHRLQPRFGADRLCCRLADSRTWLAFGADLRRRLAARTDPAANLAAAGVGAAARGAWRTVRADRRGARPRVRCALLRRRGLRLQRTAIADAQAHRRAVLARLRPDDRGALGHVLHGAARHLSADRLAAHADEGRRADGHLGGQRDGHVPGRRNDRRDSRRLGDGQGPAGARHQCGLSRRWAVRARPGMDRRVVFIADAAGVLRGLLHERRADRVERVCTGPLSDGGTRNRRELDARHGPLRQHLRLGYRRGAARARMAVWRDPRDAGCPRDARRARHPACPARADRRAGAAADGGTLRKSARMALAPSRR